MVGEHSTHEAILLSHTILSPGYYIISALAGTEDDINRDHLTVQLSKGGRGTIVHVCLRLCACVFMCWCVWVLMGKWRLVRSHSPGQLTRVCEYSCMHAQYKTWWVKIPHMLEYGIPIIVAHNVIPWLLHHHTQDAYQSCTLMTRRHRGLH